MSEAPRAGHPGRRRPPRPWRDNDGWDDDDDSPAMMPIRRKRWPPEAEAGSRKRRRERTPRPRGLPQID